MPKLPKLKLSTHAQMRLFERSVDIDKVKQAILKPDSRKGNPYGTIRVQKKFGDKILVVVYSDEKFSDIKNEYLVVTFYYLDK